VLLALTGIVARMPAVVDIARQEWLESHRRLEEETRDPRRRAALLSQVEVLMDELRRRVGQWFTLEELAGAYAGAESWSRDVISERAPTKGWPRTLAVVEGAAFHLYSRGAVDYRP
jgi:hypothetical protein